MKFKIKNDIIILTLIILLNLVIRYPVIPNEIGADTFYIHSLSDRITTYGEVQFISHPLQFLGFSSQPPSVPILISGLSQSTGLSSGYTILLLSLIVTILCIFTYYTLIYIVTKNKFQSFFATVIFSTAPEIMRLTTWTATTRALFMALFPLLFYFLLKLRDEKKRLRSILVLILLSMALMSIHHLGILILLVLFTFIVAFVITENNFEIYINSKKFPYSIIWALVFMVLISLIIFRVGFIKEHMNLWGTYTHGFIFNNDSSPKALFLHIIMDYVSKLSILLLLVPVGIFALFHLKKKKSIFENYALLSLIISAPIIGVGVYTPMFLSITLIFLLSTSIMTLLKINKTKKLLTILLPFIIVTSVCLSSFMMFHWGYKTIKDDGNKYMSETKNTASFLKNYGGNGSFTSNERGGSIYKYSDYSGMMSAPTETYEKTSNLRPKLDFNISDLMGGDIENMITFESKDSIKNNTDENNTVINNNENNNEGNNEENNVDNTIVWYQFPKLWAGNIDEGRDIINKYGIRYVLETQFGGYSVDFVSKMKFFTDIHGSKPLIYDNDKEKIYSLQ